MREWERESKGFYSNEQIFGTKIIVIKYYDLRIRKRRFKLMETSKNQLEKFIKAWRWENIRLE